MSIVGFGANAGLMSKHLYIIGIVVKGEDTRIKSEDHPSVLVVEIDGLDSRRALHHLLLNFKTQ